MSLRIRAVALLATTAALSACGTSQAPGGATAGTTTETTVSTGTPAAPSSSDASTTSAATPSRAGAADCPPEQGASGRTTKFAAAPPMCIDPAKTYEATIKTDVGTMTVALDAKKAPKTVNNFVFLARHNYYDGIVFHRVIPGFMNQTGDPQGTGMGGPGYEFADELPKEGEYKIGSVAMANAGPNTNGSQFFVVTGENGVGLPPDYSLFGQVTAGMDVMKKIEADGTPEGQPTTVHRIEDVTITEK